MSNLENLLEDFILDAAETIFDVWDEHEVDGRLDDTSLLLLRSEFGQVPDEVRGDVFIRVVELMQDAGHDVTSFTMDAQK